MIEKIKNFFTRMFKAIGKAFKDAAPQIFMIGCGLFMAARAYAKNAKTLDNAYEKGRQAEMNALCDAVYGGGEITYVANDGERVTVVRKTSD